MISKLITFAKRLSMNAIEFNAKIEHGIIRLPKKFGEYDNSSVRVIILKDSPKTPARSKEALLSAMMGLQEKDLFPSIVDTLAWQKQQRDEWE
jgi:hypothetical protein